MKAVLIACLVLLASCATQKRCAEKFPVLPDTIRTVVFRDSIVYKPLVVPVYIPGEVQFDSVLIPCPEPPATFIPDTAHAETSLAVAKAWFDFPAIRLILIQKDTTIEYRLDSALREAYYWKSEYEKIIIPQVKIEKPLIYRVALWAWIGVIIFMIFAFIVKRLI